ncbi:MAG: tetratricopeptide repeat protein [Acidobacteriia bacterium]|nr:tetratricopeptide repeat protein [Terriglobia bacterium]
METFSTREGAPAPSVSPLEVRAELQRILASNKFSNLERLSAFLRYVVEETLNGRGDRLKEVVIAMEAFGRDGSYDPRLDATVRVQAGRLRSALRDYYDSDGRSDPVEIEIPKGTYEPVFRRHNIPDSVPAEPAVQRTAESGQTRRRGLGSLATSAGVTASAVVVMLAVALASVAFLHSRQSAFLTDKDTIVLADFANTTGDPVFNDTLRQALAVDLEQSPFLNILPDQAVAQTLLLMRREPGQRLTEDVARELCQRVGAKAVLAGSIAKLGNLYVIGISASTCATGASLIKEQVQVESKEQVLKALDRVALESRRRFGEALASVHKYDTPVEQATTPSLEALQAYSAAIKARNAGNDDASIAFFKRAIELDANFAMAYALLGSAYFSQGQPQMAGEYAGKAFALRSRASERERLYIESHYYQLTTSQLEKAAQVYEQWRQVYPHDRYPPWGLAMIHSAFGNYDAAAAEFREALQRDPEIAWNYGNLAQAMLNLNRVQEAAAVLDEMRKRKLESRDATAYLLAFVRGDTGEMERQLSAATGNLGAETLLFFAQSDTEAYHGRLGRAREFNQEAVAWAIRADAKETAAVWLANGALREAEFGNRMQAAEQAAGALSLEPSQDVRTLAALALARAGQPARARAMAAALQKQFPRDSLLHAYWLPTIAAAAELGQNNPSRAFDFLQATRQYELGQPPPFQPAQFGPMYPVYLRGQALLLSHQGVAAAAEFQKIMDHPGVVLNYPLGALARLGLARAYALQGDQVKAGSEYRTFLSLWRDADPQIPVFRQAKAEYARLKSTIP